jgi:hypothetical protein
VKAETEKEDCHESRRDFLKSSSTGAVLLGSQSKLALAAACWTSTRSTRKPSPKSWCPRRGAARRGRQLDEKRVQICSTAPSPPTPAATNRSKPGSSIVPVGKVIGLKVNGLGGKGISTHLALVLAVCERLQQAGVKPGNIVVWDRNARDLRGLRPDHQHRPQPRPLLRLRCLRLRGAAGVSARRASSSPRFSPASAHGDRPAHSQGPQRAGVTFAMKNMYGVVERPYRTCMPTAATRRGRPELHSRGSREGALHHRRRHDFGL